MRMKSRIPPTKQKRERCARNPIPSPAARDISNGACPLGLRPINDGFTRRKMRRRSAMEGMIHALILLCCCALPSVNPALKKRIGSQARNELERLTGTKVFLQLWVKVKYNWTREEEFLDRFGY